MTNTADLLEQIPDLGEDIKDPEDCFTKGTALGGPLAQPQSCPPGQEDLQLLGVEGHVAPHSDLGACHFFPHSSRPWGPLHLPVT